MRKKVLHRARVLKHAAAAPPLLFSVWETRVELLEKSYLNIRGADPVCLYGTAEPSWTGFVPLQTVLKNKAQGCIS
ncbi:hypothetical protein L1987_25938 [Smallanthus sonchifolius]|uniref:Uncharacterized protein n=1 Tax=Smallanthus sonchifolius TaxID=185202 RepID=A0ACB9IBH2_9ASTR|nr:hypothetical protein L1987_25938 [Smallanthus sonchifolius]